MRIDYICHSCLHIDTGDTTLVFDPWFKGTAYMDQWHLFPPPVETSMLKQAKNILYSHGHHDHLHGESLDELSREARIFYPYQWRRGAKEFFSGYGFENVTEAFSFKSYPVSPTTTVTYIGFALESVITIEVNDLVIVNLNDALNSHHQNVVELFLREIKKRWPKIDYLFSGWSGAGYFPNTVHYPGKNDYETGLIREQYFGNHFCKIVRELQPQRAIPFAPGFVLLAPDKRWINEVKFSREKLEGYYRDYFEAPSEVEFFSIHPGDFFDDRGFHAVSHYHRLFAEKTLDEVIEAVYPAEIKKATTIPPASEAHVRALLPKLLRCLDDNLGLFDKTVLQEARFAIRLDDAAENKFLNVQFDGKRFRVHRTAAMAPGRRLLIRTRTPLLEHSVEHEWGGDVLSIGYGLDVDVYEESTLELNLDIVCVRLLARYPTASGSLRKDPLRALNYFLRHPLMSKLAIRQKLMLRNTVNKFPYNERDHWISYGKCELCKVCDMPLLSFEFGEQLKSVAD